jgi:divalent metal cation (Fe/Co/Zn/Cd) transporter
MAQSTVDNADVITQENASEEDSHLTGEESPVAAALSHRGEGVRVAVRKFTEGSDKPTTRCTASIKALAVTAFLFSFITVVQIFAAKIAHSQALLMDCISMAVDALTYMGNILVECKKRDGGHHLRSQLIVTAISLSLLLYFTYDASRESWDTVQVCRGNAPSDGDDDDVNGYITLAFALGGMVFDIISLWFFFQSHRKMGTGRALNMFTALLHCGADCLRSTSTTVMSVLILTGAFDSTCLDAYTSLFIGATIVCGALYGIVNWFKMLVSTMQGPEVMTNKGIEARTSKESA